MLPIFRPSRPPEAAANSQTARLVWIATAVLLVHAGLIWAIQNGMPRAEEEIVIPIALEIALLSQTPAPSAPAATAKPRAEKAEPKPAPKSAPKSAPKPAPTPQPAPLPKPVPAAKSIPVQVPTPTPSPTPKPAAAAPSPAVTAPNPVPNTTQNSASGASQNPNPSSPANAGATGATSPTAPVAASVQLPSSNADYLKNPAPVYPALSLRMNEQGQSLIRVLIGSDGQAQRAELAKSSGFDRLDRAAINAVLQWRFVPGKRGGVAEAMWYQVPINWRLRD